MGKKYVYLEAKDGIGWIQFDREEKLNALNPDVFRDLEAAVAGCEQDESVKVVVLRGSEKAFVAGADIEHMAGGGIKEAYALTDLSMRVQARLSDLPKPTIAAISGYALGGGCELALCCDFRIAAENAVFGQPEIKLGIIPGGGGTQRLSRIVGLGPALELVLLGEMIKADRAERIGLVNRVVAADQLDKEVEAIALKLLKLSPVALRAAKSAVLKGLNTSLDEGLQLEQALFSMLFGTKDSKEGLSAFMEKRKPEFKGE